MSNNAGMTKRRRDSWVGWAFISPWLIGFLIFTAFPFVQSIYLSFTRYTIVSPPKYVGMANYRMLLTDDVLFWKSAWVTVKYAFTAVPLTTFAALALALLLNQKVRGITLFRTIFYLPAIVPTVATSVVFMWILNPQTGLVNSVLRVFGVEGPAWLKDPTWAFWSLVFMSVWGVGNAMVIYLAGLKDVPAYLYEAAVLDGTNAWQRTKAVTIPIISPVIFFNVVMGIIGGFQYFTQAFIMLPKGGPEDSALFYTIYLFQRAWTYMDMGYASALAWVLFLVVVTLTAVVFKTRSKWVHYGS